MLVLKRLWQVRRATARELHEQAGLEAGWKLATTRTVLDRMRAKGLVAREEGDGAGVYTATQAKVTTLGALARQFRAAFSLKGPVPVAAFSGSTILTEAEIAELERILSEEDDR